MFLSAPPSLVIPEILYQRLIDDAMAILDKEICGLLLGRPGCVEAIVAARNVAQDPSCSFEIDPAILLKTQRTARLQALGLLGCYHSHPNGVKTPSAQDRAQAALLGGVWLILAQGAGYAYKSVASPMGYARIPVVLV